MRTMSLSFFIFACLVMNCGFPSHGWMDFPCPSGTTRVYAPEESGQWCQMKDGIRHGPAIFWREDGRYTLAYIDRGRVEGEVVAYWPNGRLRGRFLYRNGSADGLWSTWYENGNQELEGRYQKGLKHGLWRFWRPDGRLWKLGGYRHGRPIDSGFRPEAPPKESETSGAERLFISGFFAGSG